MKHKEKHESLRTEYLKKMMNLGTLAVARSSHLPFQSELNAMYSSKDAEESRNAVGELNLKILDVCDQTRAIEQLAEGELGIPVQFGADVPDPIRIVVALLLGKALSGAWEYDSKDVGTIVLSASGCNVAIMLLVREAFASQGILRKHIHCELGRTVDENYNLSLKESTFRTLLALESDSEHEELIKAKTLVIRNGKC